MMTGPQLFWTWRYYPYLLRHRDHKPFGVDYQVNLAAMDLRQGMVTVDDETQQWKPVGKTAVVLVPVRQYSRDPMSDLAAIDPKANTVYSLTGRALALGEDLLWTDKPARIRYHETPMDWLADHGRGICPLSEDLFSLVIGKPNITLIAADVPSGERLQRWLSAAVPPMPVVAVRRQRQAQRAA